MHKVQVKVFEAELFERVQAVPPHILMVMVPELCSHKDIRALDLALSLEDLVKGCSNLWLVAIGPSTVNVPATHMQVCLVNSSGES